MPRPDVVVVGAGMAGLVAARELHRSGRRVLVLDKGRAVGGRMATRTLAGRRYDHGAQHFSARDPAFAGEVAEWVRIGVARVWLRTPSVTRPELGIEPRHAGVGGMRRIPEHLAAGLEVRTGVQVTRLEVAGGVTAWAGADVAGRAAAAIVTAPLPQAIGLLAASELPVPAGLGNVAYDACLAVMARLDGASALVDGHTAPDGGPVAWVADNHHKGTSPGPAVTIHSTAEFAAAHVDEPPGAWVPKLREAAAPLLGSPITAAAGHRWRYSMPRTTLDGGAVAVAGAPVLVAGEAFAGARVEGAYLSGLAAAAAATAYLGP